ncbi:MAG: CBS domain-containing protein [Steroidobacterales bacterium]
MNIGELCRREVVTAVASDELLSAVQLMRARHVGYVVVVEVDLQDQMARPVGVLSDRDIVVGVVASEADVRALRVGDVMTQRPVTASESDPVATALNRMRGAGVRRLPVVGNRGQLVGVVALDDVLAELAGELGTIAGAIGREQRIETALRP